MNSTENQTTKETKWSTNENRLSSGFKFFSRLFSILIFLTWSSGLGYGVNLIWTRGYFSYPTFSNKEQLLGFVSVALVAGAFGGLVRCVLDISLYTRRVDQGELVPTQRGVKENEERQERKIVYEPERRHGTNLFIKPTLWPIVGALAGLVFSAILLDAGTGSPKIFLISFGGGLFIFPLIKKIAKTFGLVEE